MRGSAGGGTSSAQSEEPVSDACIGSGRTALRRRIWEFSSPEAKEFVFPRSRRHAHAASPEKNGIEGRLFLENVIFFKKRLLIVLMNGGSVL